MIFRLSFQTTGLPNRLVCRQQCWLNRELFEFCNSKTFCYKSKQWHSERLIEGGVHLSFIWSTSEVIQTTERKQYERSVRPGIRMSRASPSEEQLDDQIMRTTIKQLITLGQWRWAILRSTQKFSVFMRLKLHQPLVCEWLIEQVTYEIVHLARSSTQTD